MDEKSSIYTYLGGGIVMKENGNKTFNNDLKNPVPCRNLRIKTSSDKMEAYITISYAPIGDLWPPLYKINEIKYELDKAGISYGIITKNLNKCIGKEEIKSLLIAEGKKAVDGEDDYLDIKFDIDSDIKRLNVDKRGRVDFKSIGSVNAVQKGDVLALKIHGREGEDGRDVTGKVLKHKPAKKLVLKASTGCELINENTVAASIEGKPCIINNTFYVYKVHEVHGDVDLNTGNIMFIGDIAVRGSVKEGMKVVSGNSISIFQDVERAEVKGKGDIIVKGNVLGSKVAAGGEDIEKLKELEELNPLEAYLKHMITAIEEIKKFNLLGYGTPDGQIIKVLIENKYKNISKHCLRILSYIIKEKNEGTLEGNNLFSLIKDKLIGIAPLNIKHYSELFEILENVSSRIKKLKSSLALAVNVKAAYSQDSSIVSSGDIIISGKGAYVSSITAQNNIYFTAEKSVVRGGNLKCQKEIKCKIVGSPGGVTTRLTVGECGHIWIDTAYENTLLNIGEREFILDHASKNVHVYINDKSDLVVDRLRL